MDKNPLNTICDLKWNYPIFNMSRGEFRSCCRTPPTRISKESLDNDGINAFLNNKQQQESRLALIKGEKHADCQSCWNLENSGMKSPRHTPKQFWDFLKNIKYSSESVNIKNESFTSDKLVKVLDSIESTDPVLQANKPYMIEINMGNTCDMKCMYCNHHYSSQWGVELIKYGEITENRYEEEFPQAPEKFDQTFWDWFNQIGRYSINRIGIIGGEPLITPEFYILLEKLIKSIQEVTHLRSKRPALWVVTNLNTPKQYLEKFINHLLELTNFFDVSIYVSLESVEKRAEYIRFGLDWNRFTNNIDMILKNKEDRKLNFSFNFMPSVNILSVPSTIDFVKFVETLIRKYQLPIGITQNIVSFPEWQSPLLLTPDFAQYLDDAVIYIRSKTDIPVVDDKLATWMAYADFLENLSNSVKHNSLDNTDKRKKFKEWFDIYDNRRNVSLLEIFPEMHDFYSMCN